MVSKLKINVDIVNAEVTSDMEQRDIIYYVVLYFIDNLLINARKNVLNCIFLYDTIMYREKCFKKKVVPIVVNFLRQLCFA